MADQEPEAQQNGFNISAVADLANISKPATPSNARTCGVCRTAAAKYKCTRCELPYCSIACNVEHKSTHPVLPEPKAPEIKDTVMDTIPTNGSETAPRAGTQAAAGQSHVLAPLVASPDLQRLFTLYPSLKEQLREIYNASQPPTEDTYLTNDYRGGKYNNNGEKPFWTKEQGTRDGIEALKIIKAKYGQDGDGVRQFAELVVSLVSPENAINGNLDGPVSIQRQAQDENAMMITQLLNGELGNA